MRDIPDFANQTLLRPLLSSGTASVIAAYSLFALSGPLIKWLVVRGDNGGLSGGDAISFCNLLFLGNLCAAALVLATCRCKKCTGSMGKLSFNGWLSLASTVALSIITPAAFFFALRLTTVSNVIFISRAGPVFYAIGATVLMGHSLSRQQVLGYGFIGVAILAVTFSNGMVASLSLGDGLAWTAAMGAALVSLAGRAALDELGLKLFVFLRNLLSSVSFGLIALAIYGPRHFADLAQPSVSLGVATYGVIVVGAAQLLWFNAVARATPSRIGGWSFISPMIAIAATIMLLQEKPSPAHWIALTMVVIGMSIAARTSEKRPESIPPDGTLMAT